MLANLSFITLPGVIPRVGTPFGISTSFVAHTCSVRAEIPR